MPKAARKKTETKVVLGSGDAGSKFQSFDLPESLVANMKGFDLDPPGIPELEIYVSDVLWTRTASFFGHTNDDTIYIVRRDTDGHLYVQFADGISGKRLPSGTDNIVAKYRGKAGEKAKGAKKVKTTKKAKVTKKAKQRK